MVYKDIRETSRAIPGCFPFYMAERCFFKRDFLHTSFIPPSCLLHISFMSEAYLKHEIMQDHVRSCMIHLYTSLLTGTGSREEQFVCNENVIVDKSHKEITIWQNRRLYLLVNYSYLCPPNCIIYSHFNIIWQT